MARLQRGVLGLRVLLEFLQPRAAGRKSKKPPTQLVLNSGDGLRAAFYVTWDAAAHQALVGGKPAPLRSQTKINAEKEARMVNGVVKVINNLQVKGAS